MKARISLVKPDDVQATVSITTTIKEFKELRVQLVRAWPSSVLSHIIGEAIDKATDGYESETEAE